MNYINKNKSFIEHIIEKDIASGKIKEIHTRFPPEPNGYLHIGHASSICLNFNLAAKFNGKCNLRFDDTNPEAEEQQYIESIKEDIIWLGYKWHGEIKFASNYFDIFYQWAIHLIKDNKAYVDHQTPDQMSKMRGDYNNLGKPSPCRNFSVEKNLSELEKMKSGIYEEGSCCLRAKIDLSHSNINMRDPVLYRIQKKHHHQTGNKWCIYPSYDFAHGQEDSLENISHSICTLEFQDHRPLYEWFLNHLPVPHKPKQYEFARTNVNFTITSKRKLKQLVDENHVSGWDDPRMPTLSGMRRRGYTPHSIRKFCEMIGISRTDGVADISMLEFAIRDDLNNNAPRAMVVFNPVKVIINNWPQDNEQSLTLPLHPQNDIGSRTIKFTKEVYIDANDFNEDNSLSRKKFKRLVKGEYVRLRGAYVIKHEYTEKDEQGNITVLHCSFVKNTLGKKPPENIKPRGVIHWVSAQNYCNLECRLYDRLFNHPQPDSGNNDFMQHINHNSLKTVIGYGESSLRQAQPEQHFQFEREGYFVADRFDFQEHKLIFNLTIGLKDNWASKF